MKTKYLLYILFFITLITPAVYAQDKLSFDNYLQKFDNEERKNMKIGIPEMLQMQKKGSALIIDVRTVQEHREYSFRFMKHMPLNEIPKRLNELDKSKTIITVCQFSERAVIARMFLTLKGYKSQYLATGIMGLNHYIKNQKK